MACGLSLRQVVEVRDAARVVASLDQPVGAEGDAALGDLLPSEHGAFEDDVHLGLQQESIRRAVGELPEPQQSVIRRRYGIGTGRPESLYQVARELHMGPRRVRDLEADGLAQLARRRELDGLGEAA